MTQINLSTKTETNLENKFAVAKGEGLRGGMDWEFGTSGSKLLYREWINNKILSQGTIFNIL